MFKVKKLAIAALLTVASGVSIYAADSISSPAEPLSDSSSTARTTSVTQQQVTVVSQAGVNDETQEGAASSRSRTITFRGQTYVISDLLCSAVEYLFGPRTTALDLQFDFLKPRCGLIESKFTNPDILQKLRKHGSFQRGSDLLALLPGAVNVCILERLI